MQSRVALVWFQFPHGSFALCYRSFYFDRHMFISIDLVGTLNNENSQSRKFMMKSLIITATSISYILSIAIIANAKVKISAKNIDREQSCLTQTAKLTQIYDISTADIRGICQALTNHYMSLNKYGMVKEETCIKKNCFNLDREFRAFEVKKIELSSYSREQAMIRVEVINRLYKWENSKSVLDNERAVISDVRFFKKNDKWNYEESGFRY